ncbi:hypothetical protein JCM19000A_37760 [Silvimonas sp. JCM 19000]
MSQQVIEIQPEAGMRHWQKVLVLAADASTVCTIIAPSPARIEDDVAYGLGLNVLIVRDGTRHLLRGAPMQDTRRLARLLLDSGRPTFFTEGKIKPLADLSPEDAADYMIAVPPSLLCEPNLPRFYQEFQPAQGERIDLLQALARPLSRAS